MVVLVFCGYHWAAPIVERVRRTAARLGHTAWYERDATDRGFRARLAALPRRGTDGAPLLFPGYLPTVWVARRLRPSRELLAPPTDVMNAFESPSTGKMGTSAWLVEHGLGAHAPVRYNLTTVRFPAILKPKRGTNGHGVRVITARAQLPPSLRRCVLERALLNETEWGVYIAAYNGSVRALRCAWFSFNGTTGIRDKSPRGLRGHDLRADCPPPLARLARTFVAASRYTGYGCTGAKFHDGVPTIIEINTRLCGVVLGSTPLLSAMLSALVPSSPNLSHVSNRSARPIIAPRDRQVTSMRSAPWLTTNRNATQCGECATSGAMTSPRGVSGAQSRA